MVGLFPSRGALTVLAALAASVLLVPAARSETPLAPIDAPEPGDAVPADVPPTPKTQATKPVKPAKPPGTMPTKRPPDRDVGRTLYLQSCWQCHGETGQGDGPAAVAVVGGVPSLAGRLAPSEWDNLIDHIENGKGRMPAYKEDIDKHDARRILTYIQDALQGRTEVGGEDKSTEEEDNNKN